MKKYLLIVFGLIGVYLTHAQQDTMYLKNKFNEDGNVVLKDTTWMRAPLFYVAKGDGSPITGTIIEKHRKGKRITNAKNGFTLKQVGYMKKSMSYLFYDPDNKNYISIQYCNKQNRFTVLCMSDNKHPYGVDFESLKSGEIRKTISKEDETVTIEYMMKTLIEALPQYETDFKDIFSQELSKLDQ